MQHSLDTMRCRLVTACRSIVADSTDYITALEQPKQMILVAAVTGTREDAAKQRVTSNGVDSGRCAWGTTR